MENNKIELKNKLELVKVGKVKISDLNLEGSVNLNLTQSNTSMTNNNFFKKSVEPE